MDKQAVLDLVDFIMHMYASSYQNEARKLVEEKFTSTNNRSDEIAWLEQAASYPKSIGENFYVGIILKRLKQLRTMR
jgi:hypothetical protein